MDRVVLTCDERDFVETLQLARHYGVGLEIQTFAYPEALDDHLDQRVAEYQARLADFSGERTMHGAFIDMVSGSQDPKVAEVTEFRYMQCLRVAEALNARLIVFHLNYLIHIRNFEFRRAWTERQVEFWGRVGRRAHERGLVVALENMWEWEPGLIQEVLDGVALPNLKACLDVGHARLYSTAPLADWLTTLGRHLVYTHLNNNNGIEDEHRALDDGVLDYHSILPQLRALTPAPTISLEIAGAAPKERSLTFFTLPQPTGA